MVKYCILDGMCCALFLKEMQLEAYDTELSMPEDFDTLDDSFKIQWLDTISRNVVKKLRMKVVVKK